MASRSSRGGGGVELIDRAVQRGAGLLLDSGAHDALLVLVSAAPGSGLTAARSRSRPRAAWLFTVPIEQLMTAAVSASDSSSR